MKIQNGESSALWHKLPWFFLASIWFIGGCSQWQQSEPGYQSNTLVIEQPESVENDLRPLSYLDSQKQRDLPEELKLPPSDLLSRMASEFSWSINAEAPQIEYWIDYYLSAQDELQIVLERGNPYLYYISEKIQERDLPMELAFLPMVESGFNPRARSRSGAAGLWQFMPSTGRHLGLEQNWWVDERLSVTRSTDAALDYLSYLNKRFDGDWLLALAAYNSGEGTVSNELRKSSEADFWSMRLNRETRNYVPRLLAIVHIIRNAETLDLTLPQWDYRPFFVPITVDGQIDIRKLPSLVSDYPKELNLLNAQYLQNVTFPQKASEFLVPTESDDLAVALSEKGEMLAVNYAHYQVRSGDNLGAIAQRHRVNLTALMSLNNIKGALIHPGDNLLIPLSVQSNSTPNLAPGLSNITVRRGDSLSVIAERYKMRLSDLLNLNGLTANSVIFPGQELQVRTSQTTSSPVIYHVAQGDSLSVIADRFNIALKDLLSWNDLSIREMIYPGQQLSIWAN